MACLDKSGLTYLWGKIKNYVSGHTSAQDNPHNVTKAQLGLENVNNTSDSEKHVLYAGTTGEADKVKNNLTVRLNGGRTEGTDMWTYNGSTARSINITAAKVGAVAQSQGTSKAGMIFYVNDQGKADLIDLATLKSMLDNLT